MSDDAVTLGPGKRPFSLPPRKTLIRLAIAASPWALYVLWMAIAVMLGRFPAGYAVALMAGVGHVDPAKTFLIAPFLLFTLGLAG